MTQQEELNQQIEGIKQKYKPQIESLKAKGQQVAEDFETPGDGAAAVGVDFKIDWKDVELIFDVPSITLENRNISLDLPEVKLSDEKIIFDVPDVRMVDRKVGQYPEFHWPEVRWKDIIISVPEPYMRRVEIVLGLPSVTMKRQEFILGLPKMTMQQVRWVLTLPQFTIINVNVETDRIKAQGQALQQDGQLLAKQMKEEIETTVQAFKARMLAAALNTKLAVTNNYNQALGTIKTSIDDLQRQGCDPIKVPTPNGDVNLRKLYDQVDSQKVRSLAEFEAVAGTVM